MLSLCFFLRLETLPPFFFLLLPAFLHSGPPFSELPSILEIDSFHMLVNLHFALSSLFASVTCPHGVNGPNGRNPVLPALIGITDQHIVRITAAAHVLQYLLTCPPCQTPMDVDSDDGELHVYMYIHWMYSLSVFYPSSAWAGTGWYTPSFWIGYEDNLLNLHVQWIVLWSCGCTCIQCPDLVQVQNLVLESNFKNCGSSTGN